MGGLGMIWQPICAEIKHQPINQRAVYAETTSCTAQLAGNTSYPQSVAMM